MSNRYNAASILYLHHSIRQYTLFAYTVWGGSWMGTTLYEIYESIQNREKKKKKHKNASEGQLSGRHNIWYNRPMLHPLYKKLKKGFTSKDTLRDFSLLFNDRFCLQIDGMDDYISYKNLYLRTLLFVLLSQYEVSLLIP